jgi:hypothetical protein
LNNFFWSDVKILLNIFFIFTFSDSFLIGISFFAFFIQWVPIFCRMIFHILLTNVNKN